MKQLFENWNRYVNEDDQQLIQEKRYQKLIQENIAAMIAQGVISLLQSAVGRRIIAWALRAPGELRKAIMRPLARAGRQAVVGLQGEDSKLVGIIDWLDEHSAILDPSAYAHDKLAGLIEGLDDKDAEDLLQVVKSGSPTTEEDERRSSDLAAL